MMCLVEIRGRERTDGIQGRRKKSVNDSQKCG